MNEMQLNNSLEFLKQKFDGHLPEVGIILGSGLDAVAEKISVKKRVSYQDIPDFPQSTVVGHKGEFILGDFGGKTVLAMRGRFHFYEGYSMDKVVAPVRIMALMGVKLMMVSNACGGVNPDFEIGDVMIISDHINLFPTNPLIGPNNDKWGPRFPDMSQAYDHALIREAELIAAEKNIPIRKGVYAGLSGPCLETPAEYKYVRIIGADAVGMSTVPEVIAARHMGVRCFGMSVITDLGVEGKIVETTHEDVVRAANASSSKMMQIFEGVIEKL
jgi:purine-nucleoside phosphorylase